MSTWAPRRAPDSAAHAFVGADGHHDGELGERALRLTGPLEVVAPPRGSPSLRRILVLLDVLAVVASWVPTLGLVREGGDGAGIVSESLALAVAVAVAVGLIASQRLYRARVCTVRAVEMVRLWRVALLSGVIDLAIDRLFDLNPTVFGAVLRAALAFALLTLVRSGYRGWLSVQRKRGRFTRPVLIVGTNDEGIGLYRLLRDHPELGFRVCGFVGGEDPGIDDPVAPWYGDRRGVVEVALQTGATGALVAATSFAPARLNRIARELLRANLHVHLSSGLQGIASQRMNPTSLAHESLLYVEQTTLAGWQMVLKRALDLVVAGVMIVVSAPIVTLAALAVKWHDGGPVLFKQERVGRDGEPFVIYKLRTMAPDAEARLDDLREENQRSGPLFKLARDPRVTPIGRFLRATSIDELPQLVNVMQGKMSMVGPRPALASEVAHFDADLLARQQVRPGISGLWQLEARDEASFDAYQRLDVYYVENWSVLFDLAILLSTTQSVVLRAARTLFGRQRQEPSASGSGESVGVVAGALD